jgi:hypothetical protein
MVGGFVHLHSLSPRIGIRKDTGSHVFFLGAAG